MFAGLRRSQMEGALEAMLFVTDEPIDVMTFADMLEADPAEIERCLEYMQEHFEEERRGIQLREIAGGWKLFTHPDFYALVEKYVVSWDTRKLSAAMLETLAIVAYTQPVTRAQVASVRGVNSDSSINSLVEKGLLREAGTADTPGYPVLYATTRAFLERFGLRSVKDLPDLAEFAPDDETRKLIAERLSATRTAPEQDDEFGLPEGALFGADVAAGGEATAGFAEGEQGVAGEGSASDVFAGLRFDFGEDDAAAFSVSGNESAPSDSAQEMLNAAMGQMLSQSFGLVDKIDYDELIFETDEE